MVKIKPCDIIQPNPKQETLQFKKKKNNHFQLHFNLDHGILKMLNKMCPKGQNIFENCKVYLKK